MANVSSLSLTTGAKAGRIQRDLDEWDTLCIGIGKKFRLGFLVKLLPEHALEKYLDEVVDGWTGMNTRFTHLVGPVTPWGNIQCDVTFSPSKRMYKFNASVGGESMKAELKEWEMMDET